MPETLKWQYKIPATRRRVSHDSRGATTTSSTADKSPARTPAEMTIGALAKTAGVTTDTIRFYEKAKLLYPARKSTSGYRVYSKEALQRLGFIRHAQQCGMTLSEIRELLELKLGEGTCCSDVRGFAVSKKQQLEKNIAAMQRMAAALDRMILACNRENRPLDDCPILAALESGLADQLNGCVNPVDETPLEQ